MTGNHFKKCFYFTHPFCDLDDGVLGPGYKNVCLIMKI